VNSQIEEIISRVTALAEHKPTPFIEFEKIVWQIFEMGKRVGKLECKETMDSLIKQIYKFNPAFKNNDELMKESYK